MSDHPKHAIANQPIHDLIARRWSPYAFDGRPVEREKLQSCLEAARWAASSFNEQPWSFLIATGNDRDEFERMMQCLVEANQSWARHAGALLLTVVNKTFTRNGKPNRIAEHDVGLAVANLTIQATALGLGVHQMAGINHTKARQAYDIPEGQDPLTAVALGYAADPAQVEDPALGQRDLAPRSRKPLHEFVFTGKWQQASGVVNA